MPRPLEPSKKVKKEKEKEKPKKEKEPEKEEKEKPKGEVKTNAKEVAHTADSDDKDTATKPNEVTTKQ